MSMFKRSQLAMAAFVAIALLCQAATDDKKGEKVAAKSSPLDKMKKLKGEWLAVDEKGNITDTVITSFKITSGGSAVQETIHPGTPQEMVTVYHMDGKDLLLTHYCMLGNQPKLKLDPKSPADKLLFEFTGGTNMDAAKDAHMHEGSITITDDDHILWEWLPYSEGKPMTEHKVSMKLVRKKAK